MKTVEIINIGGNNTLVIVKGEKPQVQYDQLVININGNRGRSVAEGIKRMIEQDQCMVCGKFNGLHGEVFSGQSDGGGSVTGTYSMCPNSNR